MKRFSGKYKAAFNAKMTVPANPIDKTLAELSADFQMNLDVNTPWNNHLAEAGLDGIG